MSLRKILFVVSMIISVLCLTIGYGIARQWVWAFVGVLMAPAWLFARKYPNSGLPFICLLASVCLAVAGTLIGSTPLWMIFSSAGALAAWDILLLDSALGNNPLVEPTRQYENKHFQSLALALGCGLLGILLGRLSNIQIPFVVLMLFIAFILFALDRVWGYIKKAGKL